MSKFVRVLVYALVGYAVGVVAGAIAVSALSGNSHDKSVEMVMTAAFVTGPIAALLGGLIGLVRRVA